MHAKIQTILEATKVAGALTGVSGACIFAMSYAILALISP